jgi:hypothetical protein
MTNLTNLSRQKPGLGQLHEPRSAISNYVGDACTELLRCQTRIMGTESAESLTAAVAEVHSLVVGPSQTLAGFVELTRKWKD